MLDNEKAALLDQALMELKEVYPRMWRGLYLECIEQGFDEPTALELVIAFIQKPV